jgi:hypothetical protein
MARICSQCKYYDPSGEQTTCPTCKTGLQFTLLPPPNYAAAPLADVPPPNPARRPARLDSSSGSGGGFLGGLSPILRMRLMLSLIVVPILLVLSLFCGVEFGATTLRDRYDQLEPGMSPEEVKDILDPPKYSRRMPMRRTSMFDNVPDQGKCTVTWQENGATLTLVFVDGELSEKSQKGLR